MRNLCLALIVANLAFAAWQYRDAGSDAGARDRNRDVPGIMLTSERSRDAQAGRAVRRGADSAGAVPRPEAAPGDEAQAAPGDEAQAAPAELEALLPSAADRDSVLQEPGSAEQGSDPAGDEAGSAEQRLDPAVPGADSARDASGDPDQTASADAAADSARATPGPPDEAALRCRSVGPFEELSQAAAAVATLQSDGLEPSRRVAEGDIWIGYWVHLADVPTAEQARATLAELHDGGINEAYMIADPESADVISLGVFAEMGRAERLRDQVRELGHEPEIVARTRRGDVYWVDTVLEPEASLDLERLRPQGRIVRLEQRPCP